MLVVFDPAQTSYEEMLRLFWENHDPTQGMRQGNDVGTQYRSAVYWTSDEQRAVFSAAAVGIFVMTAFWLGDRHHRAVPARAAGAPGRHLARFRLYGSLDPAGFRKVMLALLLASGMALLAEKLGGVWS